MKNIIRLTVFFMLIFLIVLGCEKNFSEDLFNTDSLKSKNTETIIKTYVNTTYLSPVIVKGDLTDDNYSGIIEKGILYGISRKLNCENSSLANNITNDWRDAINGYDNPSLENGKIICGEGPGDFEVKIQHLMGRTKYYFRTYIKTNDKIVYGDLISIAKIDYSRSLARFDSANYFSEPDYDVFDLLTDEIMLPQNNFYAVYTPDLEKLEPKFESIRADVIPSRDIYKFKTEESCRKWCELMKSESKPNFDLPVN